MSFIAWGTSLLCGLDNFTYSFSIIISGILFGLFHLPAYLNSGCKKTPLFIFTVITLNLWASLVFGWLYWQYGLEAAIMSHILFHLIWYPIEKVTQFKFRRYQPDIEVGSQ
jgi:membrane protease YdiL (CAAX protease family)